MVPVMFVLLFTQTLMAQIFSSLLLSLSEIIIISVGPVGVIIIIVIIIIFDTSTSPGKETKFSTIAPESFDGELSQQVSCAVSAGLMD